jgi:hypothetical protein
MYALIETGNVLTISTKSVPLGKKKGEKAASPCQFWTDKLTRNRILFFVLNTFAAN